MVSFEFELVVRTVDRKMRVELLLRRLSVKSKRMNDVKLQLKKIVPSALHPYLGAVRRRVVAHEDVFGFRKDDSASNLNLA